MAREIARQTCRSRKHAARRGKMRRRRHRLLPGARAEVRHSRGGRLRVLSNMGHATRLVARMPMPMSARRRAVALLAAFGLCVASCSRHRGPGALSPEQSMKTFHLSDPNVRVELFAAEPNVVDPVEVGFDED